MSQLHPVIDAVASGDEQSCCLDHLLFSVRGASHALSSVGAVDPKLIKGLLVAVPVFELFGRRGGSCSSAPADTHGGLVSVPSPAPYSGARP